MTEPSNPASVPREVHSLALSRVRHSLSRVPRDRVSTDRTTIAEMLSWFEDLLEGFPGDSRSRIIRLLRGLSESDEDVRGVLRDYQALVNSGVTYDFEGGARATKAAREEIARFEETFFSGGRDGFINNQVSECVISGASSVEWVPERSRTGISQAYVVPAEEIQIRRDPATDRLVYRQGNILSQVELNNINYFYHTVTTSGKNPYGVPMFISALASLDRKRQLLLAEQRVINLMGRGALVSVTVPRPTPEELGCTSSDDIGYEDAVGRYYEEVGDLMAAGSENGIYIGPDGTEIKITSISQSGAGAPDIINNNQHRIWNGLGTVPFLRGKLDSTTQALAQVVIPIIHAQTYMIQRTVKRQLEAGFNLHLRLRGIPAKVIVKFQPITSPFTQQEAEAFRTRAEGHRVLSDLIGPAYALVLMREYDISEGDINKVPDWWPGATSTETETPETTNPNPEEGDPNDNA